MPSRVWSALGQLDCNLQTIQRELERLRAGLEVSDDQQLRGGLMDACGYAALVRDLVCAERPDATWSDRESLELLVVELEQAARERVRQRRRARLLALAEELEAGSVRHRFESRSAALNTLRLEAVSQLRALAAEPEQEKELAGPEAGEWLHWACNLEEKDDASVLQQLRRDFDRLDRFTTDVEEAYWCPAQRAHTAGGAITNTIGEAATAANVKSAALAGVPPLQAIMTMGSTPPRGSQLAPVAQSVRAPIQRAEPSHESQAGEETPSESANAPVPTFGETASTERHLVPWLVVAAVIALIAIFAGIYHFHGKNNNGSVTVVAAQSTSPPAGAQTSQSPPAAMSPVSSASAADSQLSKPADRKTADDKTSQPATADSKPAVSLLHKQAAEGTQDNIGLSVESCTRVNAQNIECWGYLSNLRGNESKISLYRVNAVDGKGNSFDLTSGTQRGFSSHNFKVPAQSRVKYSVKVPDTDTDARTLTLYLDVNNPRSVEYTFRDIPIAE